MKSRIVVLWSTLILATGAVAQQENPTPKHLMREDSAAVRALVMYPDTLRLHIFLSCEYPAAIVAIASVQKVSSSAFDSLINGFSREEQEDFWDLARYPDLVAQIAQGGRKSRDQIADLAAEYPADIRETAMKYGTGHYDVLQEMDRIQAKAQAQFEEIISDYPPDAQDALRDILRYPEIITLLNEHLSLTVRVGDRFRRNPEAVIRRADSLNLAQTRQNAEDVAAWKETIEENPDEASDLQNAASDYATENGYSQEDVNATPEPDQVANYNVTPYSYWFGYPTWYPYDYWYPYPFWFDCGFYRNHAGRIVIFGTPSTYFTNWYFYRPEHWHRYAHLGDAYVRHYYRTNRITGGNTVIVHNWVRENRNYLPRDFVNNSARRDQTIQQVAQLNIDARRSSGGRPVSPQSRDQFFQANKAKYPGLSFQQNKRTPSEERTYKLPVTVQPPEKQPAVRIGPLIRQPGRQFSTPDQAGRPNEPKQEPARTTPPGEQPVRIAPPTQGPERTNPPAQEPARITPPIPDRSRITPPPQEPTRTTPPREEPTRITPPTQEPARVAPPTQQPARIFSPIQPPAQTPRENVAPPATNFNKLNKAQEYHRDIWQQTQPVAPPRQEPPPSRVQQQQRQEPPPQPKQPPKQEQTRKPPPRGQQ